MESKDCASGNRWRGGRIRLDAQGQRHLRPGINRRHTDTIWPNGNAATYTTMGDVLNHSKTHMAEWWSNDPDYFRNTVNHIRLYHLFSSAIPP